MNARLLNRRRKKFYRRVRFEPLESRWLLSGSGLNEYDTVSPAWFANALNVSTDPESGRIGSLSGASGTASASGGEQFVDRWIVRLTPAATGQLGSVGQAERLLDTLTANFQVIRGLGLPGQLLLHSFAPYDVARTALAANPHVTYFEPDSVVYAQRTPDDRFFSNMTNLHNVGQFGSTAGADIDAPQAWAMNTGSPGVVVGVIDSGIDLAHPDLYLNVWINQGEIRPDMREQLVDIDGDGLITFYDLNDPANAALVTDHNGNGYIDALDLLQDARWADGRDTDGNGFVDDLFGWNFRTAAGEPFAPNNPSDVLGHGTHVAGTIGAIGDNDRGVTGINWRSSIMALKFLDDRNTGETSQAIAAINYATMMRTRYEANVRVLNNSWGQAGGFSHNLRAAIAASGDADILFVAAAGNGNVLGQGLNNDRTPFYPASYDLDNVIAVAATDPDDRLARFSNFGQRSVHIAAPGIGILSTLPGGRYGTANGTSMAAPHVAGVAALVWSEVPEASVAEVRTAILTGVDKLPELQTQVASGGRLNAFRALDSEYFAPTARLVEAADIHNATDAPHTIVVQYTDRTRINLDTLGDGEIVVDRQWGLRERITATFVPDSIIVSPNGRQVMASYKVLAPGGTWDPSDYGDYVVSVDTDWVFSINGLAVRAANLGSFRVQILDPSVIYVNTFDDVPEGTSLRTAIRHANAAGEPRTIILDNGTYRLSIPPEPDPEDLFPTPARCVVGGHISMWSNETTGDLTILGNVTIIGDDEATTVVDAGGIDRVFRVYPDATLKLKGVAITGGQVTNVGGAGILNMGTLTLEKIAVTQNSTDGISSFGGGIALWGGQTTILDTTIQGNVAGSGGGLFVCNAAAVDVENSTVMTNVARNSGGGAYAFDGIVTFTNSTVSGNEAQGAGPAIYTSDDGSTSSPSLSADGRFVAFDTMASNLVPGDTNGFFDVFVVDRETGAIERVSLAHDGTQGNEHSWSPSLSANGRFVAFHSNASNLVPGDTNNARDIFVFDRETRTIERVSVGDDGAQANNSSVSPSLSADGRFVAFASYASNLVAGDTNNRQDVFVFDRHNRTIERVSVAQDGTQGNHYSSSPSLSADGRFVSFASFAYNLVPEDTNMLTDIFVFDRQARTIERVSVADDGTQGNLNSFGASSLSADGRFVAFTSSASNLVPGDTNNASDVFVFDRQTRTIEQVSVAADGTAGNGWSGGPSLSADGRFVGFESTARNLVPGDTNNARDIFVFDRETRTIERVSVADDGDEGNGNSNSPFLSADGQFVGFQSYASNLVPGQRNNADDMFLFDRQQHRLHRPASVSEASVTLHSVTVADNLSPHYSGAIEGRVTIQNSLLAGNHIVPSNLDVGNGVQSLGHNLLERVPSSFKLSHGDMIDPTVRNLLGPLQDNGGATWTHSLLPGSPAIDAASVEDFPAADQRGLPRPQDGDGHDGARADIGAVELYFTRIEGTVYLDRNRNVRREAQELGLAGIMVYVDIDVDGRHSRDEPRVFTRNNDPATVMLDETGMFSMGGLTSGTHRITPELEVGWSVTAFGVDRVSVSNDGAEGNAHSSWPSLSADGRFVAFHSYASNLVPGDTNDHGDVFVFDRHDRTIDRVSVANDGSQGNHTSWKPSLSADGRFVAFLSGASNLVPGVGGESVFVFDLQTRTIEHVSVAHDGSVGNDRSGSPSISADGRFVAFESWASNLVPGDTNQNCDVFVFDRLTGVIERVSVRSDGTQADNLSWSPSISADGRFVAFESRASNLVPGDTNLVDDVFVFDRLTGMIERVSVASDGTQADGPSGAPSLSADGRFVAFKSRASNLVPGDTNLVDDVFVFDRQTRTIERVSVASDGTQGDGSSGWPSLSADGRFVSFTSWASNLVAGDTNYLDDVFVFDRQTATIKRASMANDNAQANDWSASSSLSADGRFVAFASFASNLVPGDTNNKSDMFVVPNKHVGRVDSLLVRLHAGQVLSNVDIGLVPDPGQICGRLFEDVIGSGVYDSGEPVVEAVTVYLDLNFNGRWDPGEPHTLSAPDGSYSFTEIDSYLEYQIGVVVPDGFSLVSPSEDEIGFWRVFLPASGTLSDRDFGFRRVAPGGQFENAVIEGRLFRDDNGNGVFDEGEAGLGGWTVFLDLNDDGVRQYNEPQTLTSSDDPGFYSFPGLGNRPYTVRVLAQPRHLQTGPVGNLFTSQERTLSLPTGAAASPQDVITADFNGDGNPDLAVALYDHNAVSVLLNDGHGRFDQAPITIELAPAGLPTGAPRGLNPTALVAGDFNGSGSLDLAVVNSSSSNVAILLDFDGTGFATKTFVPVGLLPSSIAAGYVAGEDKVAFLAVTNELGNTVSILRNNGHGVFAADPNPIPVGNRPASVVAGYFNDDPYPDLAVANYGTHPSGSDLGHVSILLANGPNGFHPAQPACPVGMGPASIVVADLDGDGHTDLAVANFLSNTVTVCAGAGDGTFTTVAELSAGAGPVDIAVADLDGTGRPDLLVANVTSNDVAILRNRSVPGSFQFEPPESYGVARFAGSARLALAVADFDGSGLTDLVVANNADRNVSVHLNTLVAGAHRVALTGVETVGGLDFALKPLNLPPTLDPIADPPVIYDDPGVERTVLLSGISAGDGETQPLMVTAATDNPDLFASLTVAYTSPDTTGTLRYTVAAGQDGSAVVTVTVTDGGLDGDLNTPDDNASFSRSFTVRTVRPPTLDPIPDRPAIDQDSSTQTTPLSGISAGGESRPLRVTAKAASNPGLFSAIWVDYQSPNATGTLRYTPAPAQYGMGVIMVTVTHGGLDADLDTPGDNLSFSRAFLVTVRGLNHPPTLDAIADPSAIVENHPDPLMITLTGISAGPGESQPLRITAVSENTALIPHPEVDYTSPNPTGALVLGPPLPYQHGTAVIRVTVEDAGLDGNFDTVDDNASFSRLFTVTVTAVNNAPQLDDRTFHVSENAASGTLVGIVQAFDPDVGDTHTYAITGGNLGSVFAIGAQTGLITVADPAGLDYDSVRQFVLTVQVTDSGGLTDTAVVTIHVLDANRPPQIHAQTFYVDENVPHGTVVGTVAASDPDANDVLTYWITAGNVGGTFAIGGLTGQLTVNTPPGLDFETRAQYTLTVEVKDRRGLTASAPVTVHVNDLNDPPTLDAIADRAVDKDAGEQLVALTGIFDGDDGTQPLAVTALSSNPSLIPHPVVEYTDGSDSGVLRFSPAAERSGTALITVTVTDGGLDKDLSTAEDNATFSRTFQVVVNDNDVYISPIPDPAPIERNAPQQTVIVMGIASGRGPSQPLAVTARSDREDIIPTPIVSYTSPDSVAVLTYRPVPDASGTAVITVTVMDGGPDGDLATEEDNVFRSESFAVVVRPPNNPPFVASPIPDQQTYANRLFTFTFDADVFQDPDDGDVLTFTATGAAGAPLPAWLGFEPFTRTFSGTSGVVDVGVFEILVTARDSGGLGVSDTFVLTVLPGNSWHNQSNPYDVNGDGEVTPMDVLALINYLNAHGTGPLPSTPEPPPYLDVNNDGDITPTDVLAVVNYLNAKVRNGEGEAGGRMSVGTTADVGPVMPQAIWFPADAVTDRVVGPWSCEPVLSHAAEVSDASEFDRLLFVHSQRPEEREILPFFNGSVDETGSSDELEDILAEIACDIAEAFLAL